MKKILFIFMNILVCACSQRDEYKHKCLYSQKKIESIRYIDTLSASFCLDSTFLPIGRTFDSYGADDSFNYSDGRDSIYILSYDVIYALPFDSFSFKKKISDDYSKVSRVNISNRGKTIYATYQAKNKFNSYIVCSIYNQPQKVSFEIFYQTPQICSDNIKTFNRMCDSFTFTTRLKKNKGY